MTPVFSGTRAWNAGVSPEREVVRELGEGPLVCVDDVQLQGLENAQIYSLPTLTLYLPVSAWILFAVSLKAGDFEVSSMGEDMLL